MVTLDRMSENPNLGRQFEQVSLPGMEESESNKAETAGYDPGPDTPRFSAIPGQQVFDFGGHVAQTPKSVYAAKLGNPEGLEHDVHGFISDPSLPVKAYETVNEQRYLPTSARTLGPDHPLHTLQPGFHTSLPGPDTKMTIEALRDIPEFSTKPMVMRVEGRDVVINGHHRIAAARRRGEGSVDVDYMDADAHGLDFRHGNWQSQAMPANPPASKQEYWDLPVPSRDRPAWHEELGISPSAAARIDESLRNAALNPSQSWESAGPEPYKASLSTPSDLPEIPSSLMRDALKGILRDKR